MSQDPYSYPGTNVLRNKEGIKDPEKLADFEYQMATLREIGQSEKPIDGKFDLKHLQDIHKDLFQDVYDWAGENRTVGISKGGSSFAQPELIESYANSTVFKDLKKDNLLQGLAEERFVERLAHHFSEINALHPFREGNGRATRVFVEELSKQAGYKLDFDKVDPQAWNDASRASFNGRMEPIEKIFREITTPDLDINGRGGPRNESPGDLSKPERAVAFQSLPMLEALARHPELDGPYSELRSIAKDIDPQLPKSARQTIYDVAKETIGRQLERGELPAGDVTRDESRKVIGLAAEERGLKSIREGSDLQRDVKGDVVAVSSQHALVKMSGDVAVVFAKDALDRPVEPGDRVAIQYGEPKSQVHDVQQHAPKAQAMDKGPDR